MPGNNFNGTDTFLYRASDGSANSSIVTVTITVNPVNDAPVAVADSYSVDEDTALHVQRASEWGGPRRREWVWALGRAAGTRHDLSQRDKYYHREVAVVALRHSARVQRMRA